MKLKCLIGSLSCDGILAEKGDIFELPSKTGKDLIKCGYAEKYDPKPLPDVQPDGLKDELDNPEIPDEKA